MSKLLSISCPNCGAGLKLKNNSFVGKKVPCPKCKKPFVVEEPPEDEFLDEVEDDFEAMDDGEEDDDFEAPARKSKSKSTSKSGKGKKKSKAGGGGKIAVIAGGVLLGLGLIGGIVYGAIALIGSSGGNSWVKWLPEDTDVAVQFRVADSMNAPVFKPITDHPTLSKLVNQPMLPAAGQTDPVSVLTQVMAIQAKDIDTVTVGAVDGLSVIEANKTGGNAAFTKFVGVMRTRAPFDSTKLDQAPATALAKSTHGSKSIYSVVGTMNPSISICAVDASTLLFGSDAELKAAIDGNGKAPAAKRFDFVDNQASLVFAAAPKDETRLKSIGFTTFTKSVGGGTQDTGGSSGVHGVSYAVTFSSDIRVEMRSSMEQSMTQPSADQMKKDMDALRPQLQAQMNQMGGGFNPFVPVDKIQKLMGHVDQMLASSTASASGSTAKLTMTLSGQLITDSLEMAAPLMPFIEAELAKRPAIAPTQASNSPGMPMPGMPMMPTPGGASPGITSYPGMVIDAGEKSKDRIGNIADQHNADLEAQMNQPPSAPGTAPNANMSSEMMRQMQELQPAGNGQPAANPASPGVSPEMMRQMQERNGQAGGNGQPAANPASPGVSPEMMRQMQERNGKAAANPATPGVSPDMMRQMQRGEEGAPPPNMRRDGEGQPAGENGEESKPAPRSRSRRRSSK